MQERNGENQPAKTAKSKHMTTPPNGAGMLPQHQLQHGRARVDGAALFLLDAADQRIQRHRRLVLESPQPEAARLGLADDARHRKVTAVGEPRRTPRRRPCGGRS